MITSTRPTGKLRELSPDKITRNPQNPRLFSVAKRWTLCFVNKTIWRSGADNRIPRWRPLRSDRRRKKVALRQQLNLRKIPALVQEKPSPLDNLLLMFNIHSLREQWDYLTIAKKLPDVIRLHIEEEGYEPNEIQLSEVTGLTRGQIRRCRYLLELPDRYREILEAELELPKSTQQLSEDFFIEMERALRTVVKRVPGAVADINIARDV